MDQGEKFCPNCGNGISSEDSFCDNCGFNLKQEMIEDNQYNEFKEHKQKIKSESRQRKVKRKPIGRGKKILITFIIIVIAGFFGGYFYLKSYYSRDNQLNRAITALSKENYEQSLKYLTSEDANLKLNKKSIKPLLTYVSTHHNLLQLMKNSNNKDGDYKFVRSGSYFLIFPSYKFRITGVYPEITTNTSNTKVTVSGTKLNASGKMKNKEIGPLVPGKYTFVATAKISGKNVTNKITKDFINVSDTDVNLSFKTVSFTAIGYPGAIVNIDGTKVGTINQYRQLDVQNYPVTDSSELTETYVNNKTTITSKSVPISNANDTVITVGYPGVISHDDAESLMNDIYDLTTYLSGESDTESSTELAKTFTNGSNNKFYLDMMAMATGYRKDDNISSVNITSNFKHVYPLAKNQAKIVYDVDYEFYKEDGSVHKQVFQYQGEIDKVGVDDYRLASFKLLKKVSDETE